MRPAATALIASRKSWEKITKCCVSEHQRGALLSPACVTDSGLVRHGQRAFCSSFPRARESDALTETDGRDD